ncbi:glycosyltransferase family 2 protein [Enterobacteriaceae bacterium LUAb1]
MAENPLISVIIPSYGRPDSLPQAIQSVLDQTCQDIEILVVNDNPQTSVFFAATNDVKKQFMEDSRVRILADGVNRGGSGARNAGILQSKGEFISFLDDDDIYFANKLECQLTHLRENNLDVSVCDMVIHRDGIPVNDPHCTARVGDIANFIIQGNTFTPMIFCKRHVLISVGMFHDTPRFQDHVLMIKILENGFIVKALHTPLFVHNDHQGERITLSDKSVLGYQIRRQFESVHLHKLNTSQRRYYNLKVALLNARIMRNENRWGATFREIACAYFNIANAKQFMAVTRRFGSVLLKSRTTF